MLEFGQPLSALGLAVLVAAAVTGLLAATDAPSALYVAVPALGASVAVRPYHSLYGIYRARGQHRSARAVGIWSLVAVAAPLVGYSRFTVQRSRL